MRYKLIASLSVVIAAGMLVGGATVALFTDQAMNVGNSFTAGTVDIDADRDLGDPIPGPMFYTTVAEGTMPGQDPDDVGHPTGQWYPGKEVSRLLIVRNMGSLRVRLHGVSAEITAITGLPSGADPALVAESFAENMDVKIYVSGQPTQVLYDGPLSDLVSAPQPAVHRPVIARWNPPAWPSTAVLCYEVTMDIGAGNDLQGIRPVVSFNVHAEQTRNNP